MKDLRSAIENYQRSIDASWTLIEQDYALSVILYGISRIEKLKKHLIFKGGTCLKKYYFGNYRFSQDADFSVQGDYPSGNHLANLLNQACQISRDYLLQKNISVHIECIRYQEKKPHPDNQEAFTIAMQYPWQKEPLTRVMVEITSIERVTLPISERPIIHNYEPDFIADLFVYSLEEIIGEKIRALIQFDKKLHERGWGRSRARDYYDLWMVLRSYKTHLNFSLIDKVVREKCANKSINFEGYHQLFSEGLMQNLEESWDQWVKPLVPKNLPKVEIVIDELKNTFLVMSKPI